MLVEEAFDQLPHRRQSEGGPAVTGAGHRLKQYAGADFLQIGRKLLALRKGTIASTVPWKIRIGALSLLT